MENNITENYYTKDGSVRSKATSKKLTIKDKAQNKCMRCGNENNLKDNYCILCGNVLHYIATKDKSIQKSKDSITKDSWNSIQNIKKSCVRSPINLKSLNYINMFLNPIIVIGLTIMYSAIFKQILLVAIV